MNPGMVAKVEPLLVRGTLPARWLGDRPEIELRPLLET
jgi:hypothetical protein